MIQLQIVKWARSAEILDKEAAGSKKKIYHLEQAAIDGHPEARCTLGMHEKKNWRFDSAMKHFIIAANLGHDDAMKMVKMGYETE